MNVLDSKTRTDLESAMKCLGLRQQNMDIAMEYFLAPEADDTLLGGVVEQPNFRTISDQSVNQAFIALIRVETRTGMNFTDRVLKFLWAAGGASTCSLMCKTSFGRACAEDSYAFRAAVLGNPRAAAMEATGMFVTPYMERKSMPWQCELAEKVPDEILEAMELCKGAESHGFGLLCGLLLQCAPERMDAKLTYRLRQNLAEAVPKILFGLPAAELQVMTDYVLTGDLSVCVPKVPSIPNPAVDAASAQEARWRETHLLRTYGMAAMLGADRVPMLRCMLRLLLTLYPRKLFSDALSQLSGEILAKVLPILREDCPGGGVSLALFYASQGYSDRRHVDLLMELCRPDMDRVMRVAAPAQYVNLVSYGMESLPDDELRKMLARSIADIVEEADRERSMEWLMGQGSLHDAPVELSGIAMGSASGLGETMSLLRTYADEHGLDDFVVRCCAFTGLICFDPKYFSFCWMEGGKTNGPRLRELIGKLCEHGLPVGEVLLICSKLHEHVYWDEHKELLRRAATALVQADRVPAFAVAVKKGDLFLRGVALDNLEKLTDVPGAKEAIFSAVGDSSKQIRDQVYEILIRHPEWAEDCKKLLTSKKAAVRLLAVQVLGRIGETAYLESLLDTETNAKVAEAIRSALGASDLPPVGSAEDIANNLLKGNKVKKLSWLIDQPLRKLRKTDGSDADENIRNAILLSYCELGRVGRSDTAAQLAAELDANDLSALACQTYEYWYAAGAQSKHKWVLSFAAVFGGPAMTQRLKTAINDWPNHQRGAIACDAVMALALSTDPAAIVIVDAISRKFKFRQVKQAAEAALKNAAAELGITAEELADRIVPDLGFGKDGKRVFDYGKRSFTVRLTPTLELDITNDAGKTVKNLPAPSKTDDPQAAVAYEEFKNMKKQIKTTVTAQRARLESALSVLRCWDNERWNALFVENPIMHQFAMSLIWGVYEDGRLTDTFRYMEDGSFNTVDEDEYELPANAKIGLVHPVELDAGTLDGWKQQLEDYEVTQSLDQLNRPVYTLDPAKAGEKALEDFGGKKLNGLSLSGKLLGQGWYRGSVLDGGVFYTFWREDAEQGIGVELRFSGSAVGFDDGEPVTVYDAVFYRGTVRRGSYIDEQIKEENIVHLGDVPVRYYSEIIHHLTRATASSTETNESWRNDR